MDKASSRLTNAQPETVTHPDPSLTATAQTEKAVACLREVHEERMKRNEKIAELQQRFNEKEVSHLKALADEKFDGVQKLNDERRRFNEMLAKMQQDAADKQEAAATKQIEFQGSVLQTEVRGLYSKIDDSRNAITELKALAVSYATAKTETKTDRRDASSMVFGIVGAIIGAIAIVLTLMKSG